MPSKPSKQIALFAALVLLIALAVLGYNYWTQTALQTSSKEISEQHSEAPTSNAIQQIQTEQSEPNPTTINTSTPMVTIDTNLGQIKLELDADKAPYTVKNFLNYAEQGHYDGTVFHRVISNFMIQGGGFEPGLTQKSTNAPIPNEANNGLLNEKYSIAMARTNDPHSATSQFFINTNDNDFLNFTSESGSGWGYAVFGKVVEGADVVDKIEAVQTGQVGPHGDVPQEDVVIEKVSIL